MGQETTTHQGMLPLSYVGLRKMVQAQCREHGVQEPRYTQGMRPYLQWPDMGSWSHPRVVGQETITHQGMLPFPYVRTRKLLSPKGKHEPLCQYTGLRPSPISDMGSWSHPRVCVGQETTTPIKGCYRCPMSTLGRWS